MSAELELVKALSAHRPGQVMELYRRGEEFLCVSTLAEVGAGLPPEQQALVSMGNVAGSILGRTFASSGEETMAFVADADGEVLDWGEVAAAVGSDSRERVLEQLRDGVDLRADD